MNIMSSDLVINNIILPDNINSIKIGDEFRIEWEIIRYATGYSYINNRLMNILLDIRIEFKGDNVTEKKYINAIQTGKIIVPYTITKRNNEFDIISKLYEIKYFGLYKKLKWECTTKHRISQETQDELIRKRLEIKE